jgi:release factor glutamine methyltransferase
MNIGDAQRLLQQQLDGLYGPGEAAGIAHLVLEHLTGFSRMDRLLHKGRLLDPQQEQQLQRFLAELQQQRPVQYVLGEAWFAGCRLYVNEHVLIPRPETEELVDWIDRAAVTAPRTILDIGTGSGCIAIALRQRFPAAAVWAADISTQALEVAARNARTNGAELVLRQLDILDVAQWEQLPPADIIVSNPPYILQQEELEMAGHVLRYEPRQALFVPDHAPLLFYEAIAELALQKLRPGGQLFFEINEQFGQATVDMLAARQFAPELRQDLQGKNRMVRASLLPVL